MLRGEPCCKGLLVSLRFHPEIASTYNTTQHRKQSTLVACSHKAVRRKLRALIVVNHWDSLSQGALWSPSPVVIFSPVCLWCQVP